jgi:hypothetical protein
VILYSAENATQVALDAIQCLGGNGYINDYPTGRILRDAKLYEIGAGPPGVPPPHASPSSPLTSRARWPQAPARCVG